MNSLLDAAKILFTHGGIFPYVNTVVAAVSIAIIVERSLALFRYSISSEKFMAGIVRMVREGQIDRAVKLCAAAPDAVLSRVIQAGLVRSNRGEAEVSAAMEEALLEVTPQVSKRIPSLFPLANIATLVGLIGTISGLIKSFSALAEAAPEQKSQILSLGISEAMYNTGLGLSIAVICIIGQLILGNKAKALLEEVEFNAMKLENLLARRAAGEVDVEKAA